MPSKFSVLVIEENARTSTILESMLGRLGCVVGHTHTAEEGVKRLTEERFEAVFAELCVREMGGRAVARWIKQEGLQTKFFLITSWKGDLEHNLLLFDGIDDVVRKPLIFSEIRDRIIRHLG